MNKSPNRALLTLITLGTIVFCFFISMQTTGGETNNGFVQIGNVASVYKIPYSSIANKPLWIFCLILSIRSLLSMIALLLSLFFRMSTFRFRFTQITVVLLLITNVTLLYIFRNLLANQMWPALFIIVSLFFLALLDNYFKQGKAYKSRIE